MKQPIEWHEDCISKNEVFCRTLKDQILDLGDMWFKQIKKLEDYRKQIELAKSKGFQGFDKEKFGKKVKKGSEK